MDAVTSFQKWFLMFNAIFLVKVGSCIISMTWEKCGCERLKTMSQDYLAKNDSCKVLVAFKLYDMLELSAHSVQHTQKFRLWLRKKATTLKTNFHESARKWNNVIRITAAFGFNLDTKLYLRTVCRKCELWNSSPVLRSSALNYV